MRGRLLPLLLAVGCATSAAEDDVDFPPASEAPAVALTTPRDGGGAALVIAPRDRSPLQARFTVAPEPGGALVPAAGPARPAAPREDGGGGWVDDRETRSDAVRFRPGGYDVIRTECGGVAIGRLEVDWSSPSGDRWIRGGTLRKDPFQVRPAPRLPPRPQPASEPRVDERGRPTGTVIPR